LRKEVVLVGQSYFLKGLHRMDWVSGTVHNCAFRSWGMWCSVIASVILSVSTDGSAFTVEYLTLQDEGTTWTFTQGHIIRSQKTWIPYSTAVRTSNIMPLVCAQKYENIPGRTWVELLVFSLRQRKGDSFLARGRSGITNSDYCISTISCSCRHLKIQDQHSISKWKMWCWMTAQELHYTDSTYYTVCFDM